MESRKKLELYFHIPFCARKCLYCDFLSAPAEQETQDAYMEALLEEVETVAKHLIEDEEKLYEVDTIFIGGGTPSVVDARWISKLLQTVREDFVVRLNAEITMEINPGTVDEQKLRCYFQAGVNRLSIGLQSADDKELKRIGRIHTWQDFTMTYDMARKVGFANINVDVMGALPGQRMETYCLTLAKLLNLTPQPEHISAYSLIVEEGTPFFEMQKRGELSLPEEEEERLMYEKTAEILGNAGYARYEISNYAKAGHACHHNCGYWKRTDYLGFGIGAASLINNVRFQNTDKLEEYLLAPQKCRGNMQSLSNQEQMEEFLFLGLRMTEGVSEGGFYQNFGKTLEEVYGPVIDKNIEDGLLEYRKQESGEDRRLALTLRGIDISNYVMAQFLLEEE